MIKNNTNKTNSMTSTISDNDLTLTLQDLASNELKDMYPNSVRTFRVDGQRIRVYKTKEGRLDIQVQPVSDLRRYRSN